MGREVQEWKACPATNPRGSVIVATWTFTALQPKSAPPPSRPLPPHSWVPVFCNLLWMYSIVAAGAMGNLRCLIPFRLRSQNRLSTLENAEISPSKLCKWHIRGLMQRSSSWLILLLLHPSMMKRVGSFQELPREGQ